MSHKNFYVSTIVLAILFLLLCTVTTNAASPANYSLSQSAYDVYDNTGSLSVSVTASMTANPGYEDGLTGWALFGSGASASSSVVHSGIGSAYVVSTTGNFIGASQRVLATGGETLMLDAYCYPTAYVGANSVYVQIYQYNATGGIIGTYTIAAPSTLNQWHELTGTFTTNANTVNVLVSIITYDGSIAYFDDVKLIPVSYTGSVDYATADSTAMAGYDYTATSGTLSFAAGETSKTFSVPIIYGNAYHGDRFFSVALSSPVNGTLSSPSTAYVDIIDTHSQAHAIPAGGYLYAYVTDYNSNMVSVLDPANNNQKITDIKVNSNPINAILNPTGTMLAISYNKYKYVDIYSTIDFTLIKQILITDSTGPYDVSIAFNGDGTKLYVSNANDNKVSIIDVNSGTIITTTTAITNPESIIYYKTSNYVFIADRLNDVVYKLDPNTLNIIGSVGSIDGPSDLAIDYTNSRLYASGYGGKIYRMTLSSTSVFALTHTYNSGYSAPLDKIAINNTGYIFVSLQASDKVTVLNSAGTSKGNFSMPSDSGPFGIAYNVYNDSLYVCGAFDNTMYILNPVTGAIIQSGYIGNEPYRVIIGTQATRAVQLTQFKLTTLGYLGLDGVPAAVYLNGNLLFTGVTDGSGVFACYLNPTSTYQVAFNSPANGVNASYTITPINLYYQFDQPFLDVVGGQFSNLLGPIVTPDSFGNQSQVYYPQSADYNQVSNTGYINGTYIDYSGATTALSFKLYGNNSTFGGSPTLIETQTAGAGGDYNFTVLDAGGNSYYVEITATQSDGNTKKYYPQGVGFPGQIVLAETGIPLVYLFWIGLCPPLFIFGAGAVTRRGYLGLVGTIFAGFIGFYCGWYRIYIPDLLFGSAFVACFLLSLGMIIVEHEKYK